MAACVAVPPNCDTVDASRHGGPVYGQAAREACAHVSFRDLRRPAPSRSRRGIVVPRARPPARAPGDVWPLRPSNGGLRVSTDATSTFTGDALTVAATATYAVIWSHGEAQPVRAGRLELRDEYFALHGGAQQGEVREHVAYPEIAAIHRPYAGQRLGVLPALRIDRCCGPSLLLASIAGVGILREIADALVTAVA